LIGADLSGANLSKVKWKNFRFFRLPQVEGANFENAKINDREFVEYLRKNGAINVPSIGKRALDPFSLFSSED